MRSLKPCNTPGCPNLGAAAKCDQCQRSYDATIRRRRDPRTHKHYNSAGHRRFRRLVLQRDSLCVICGDLATDADHYPLSLRELWDANLDPNDPARGRGLCHRCHSSETAKHQPGGWAVR